MIGAVWYFFSRYIVPMVTAHSKAYRQWRDLIQVQKEELEAACEHLQEDVAADKEYAISLEEKFDMWQQSLDKKADQQDLVHEKLCLQAQAKKNQQIAFVRQQKYMATQLPLILEQAERELVAQFQSAASKQNYTQAIVKHMEREHGKS